MKLAKRRGKGKGFTSLAASALQRSTMSTDYEHGVEVLGIRPWRGKRTYGIGSVGGRSIGTSMRDIARL